MGAVEGAGREPAEGDIAGDDAALGGNLAGSIPAASIADNDPGVARYRDCASTTDVSICRAGMSQYVFSSSFLRSSETSSKPLRS